MHWTLVTILGDSGALFYILSDHHELQLLFLLYVLPCCWYQDLFDAEFTVRNGYLVGKSSLVYIRSPHGSVHRRATGSEYTCSLKFKKQQKYSFQIISLLPFLLPGSTNKNQSDVWILCVMSLLL